MSDRAPLTPQAGTTNACAYCKGQLPESESVLFIGFDWHTRWVCSQVCMLREAELDRKVEHCARER